MELLCTEVFDWNWSALQLKTYVVKPHEGDPTTNDFYMYDEDLEAYVFNATAKLHGDGYTFTKMNANPDLYFLEDNNALHEFSGFQTYRYKYIINEGGSRSSKTYSLIDLYDLYARENKNERMTVWRDTQTDCRNTVFNDYQRRLRSTNRWERGFTFNKTKYICHYKSATDVEAHGTDDDEKVHGLTQHVSWLNEPYKISRATFDQIDNRTSRVVFIDWNPKKAHWIDTLKKNDRAITIKSNFRNNKWCPRESRQKFLSYQPLSRCSVIEEKIITEEEAKTYDGQMNPLGFSISQLNELYRCLNNERTGTASKYDWAVYGLGEKAEKPNRIYTNWTKCTNQYYNDFEGHEIYVVDWGTVDPFGIGKQKYADGEVVYKELNYDSENAWRDRFRNDPMYLKQIDQEDGVGMAVWLFEKLQIPKNAIIVCDTNRPKKILALREAGWEYAVAVDKGGIMDGISSCLNLKVSYTEDSENMEMENENYSYEVDRYGVQLEKPEDVDNHLKDGFRYGVRWWEENGIIRGIA